MSEPVGTGSAGAAGSLPRRRTASRSWAVPRAADETAGEAPRVLFEDLERVAGAQGARRFVRFADALPGTLTGYLGAELRLDEPGRGPDLLAYVERPECLALPELRARLAPTGPDLDRLRVGLRDPPPRMAEPLRDGWLEWDLGNPGQERPSVFAAPGPTDATRSAVVPVYEALGASRASRRMRKSAATLCRALRGRGAVMQVGVMAGPRAAGCRVVLTGRDPGALITAALKADWPGAHDEARALAAWATALGVPSAIDLDLGEEGFGPSIGVELTVPDRAAHDRVLQGVSAAGLCDPEIAAALAGWRIIVTPGEAGSAFPRRLLRTREFLGPHATVAVLGWLNHVKITAAPEGPPRAKAYLGIRERVGLPRGAADG